MHSSAPSRLAGPVRCPEPGLGEGGVMSASCLFPTNGVGFSYTVRLSFHPFICSSKSLRIRVDVNLDACRIRLAKNDKGENKIE